MKYGIADEAMKRPILTLSCAKALGAAAVDAASASGTMKRLKTWMAVSPLSSV